jgi:hypothetical protein
VATEGNCFKVIPYRALQYIDGLTGAAFRSFGLDIAPLCFNMSTGLVGLPRVVVFFLCGGTLGTATTTDLLYQPRIIGGGDCGEIGGLKIGRGNRSTRRKPAPAPLCPPQIPHD